MQRVTYVNIVERDTFIGRYMSHMQSIETASAYDFWMGVWLLSIAATRRVRIARPRVPVTLNWYIILLAESGVTRKSTAIREATKIAQQYLAHVQDFATEMMQSKITPELIEKRLSDMSAKYERCGLLITVDELVRIVGRSKDVRDIPALLTDLYDCPDLREGGGTVYRGATVMKNVYMSMIGACAPSWLNRSINEDVMAGGFTSRCMFVVSERPKARIAWPEITDDVTFRRECINYMVKVRERASVTSDIQVSPDAIQYFTKWYRRRRDGIGPFITSFDAREDTHVLRLAGCLAINDETWQIEERHLATAIKIIAEIKTDGASIFERTFNTDRIVNAVDRIIKVLVTAGESGIEQTSLYDQVRKLIDNGAFRTLMTIMHELDLVQMFVPVEGKRGRPKTIWRGTDRLTAPGIASEVVRRIDPKSLYVT